MDIGDVINTALALIITTMLVLAFIGLVMLCGRKLTDLWYDLDQVKRERERREKNMAQMSKIKRKVDRDQFEEYIHSRGYSIRSLAYDMDVNDKTIRRILSDGECTVTIADAMCRHLGVDMNTLFGPDEGAEWQEFLRRVM